MHCKEAGSKWRRMLFMIWRSFAELSASTFAALYNTLVRPHLQYAMQSCSPNLDADADCLEQIQRLATRFVKGFRRLPYEERLRRLDLHSLRRRRLPGDLIPRHNIWVLNSIKLHDSSYTNEWEFVCYLHVIDMFKTACLRLRQAKKDIIHFQLPSP